MGFLLKQGTWQYHYWEPQLSEIMPTDTAGQFMVYDNCIKAKVFTGTFEECDQFLVEEDPCYISKIQTQPEEVA